MAHVHHFSYGPLTPVAAYLMSFVGSFLGLLCMSRARASTGRSRASWLSLAALAIGGTGIWVMHFIAMLGFSVSGMPIRYNVPVTLLSCLTAVAVVGNVGGATKGGKPRGESFNSGAAVYMPSEEVFGHTGIFSDLPMSPTGPGAGATLISRDIPLADIRAVRHDRPEAWPGPWDAGHVKIVNKG